MFGKILVIGVMIAFIILIVAIVNVAFMTDDASEKWLEEHKNNKS